MRFKVLTVILMSIYFQVYSQSSKSIENNNVPKAHNHSKFMYGQRKFNILIINETDPIFVDDINQKIIDTEQQYHSGNDRGVLSDALQTAFSTTLMTKTTNVTSNVLKFTVNTITEAVKDKRTEWYKTAQEQCTFSRNLVSETKKDDFYALPSINGAFDPQNMKFKGFGLQHYIETPNDSGNGLEVFKMFCCVKKDQDGINSIVNHGKFLVDISEFWFKPEFCGLPHNSKSNELSRFDFNKRDNLIITIKVKIFSSWFNEAIMLHSNQQLGEFIINARITPELINEDGVFIYNSENPKHKEQVSVTGESFMVPRSYTGTLDAENYQPSWGTGEYRIEMEVSQTCKIKDSYYQIPKTENNDRENPNIAELSALMASPGKTIWDKAKWKPEWQEMKKMPKGTSYWSGVWQNIISTVKGNSWIETFAEPLIIGITNAETAKLSEWLEIPQQSPILPESKGQIPQNGNQENGNNTPKGNPPVNKKDL